MSGNRLVIGIDYGTTFTGVAYCEAVGDNPSTEDIQVIHDWPGVYGQLGTKEKVPSEISYSASNGKVLWGSQIPPQAQRQVWTKLELDEAKNGQELQQLLSLLKDVDNIDLSRFKDTDGLPAYPGKDPVEIVADFLFRVRGHLITNLQRSYGDTWRTMPTSLVVTVPAVWSDKAKDLTLQAVSRAGFDESSFPYLQDTSMITEPEAAAIYVLKSLQRSKQAENITPGDCFVLCDAGGGTVDLISYRVKTVSPKFTIEEAAIGTGEKCGGSFVDRNFTRWLEKRLGKTDYKKMTTASPGRRSSVEREWKMGRLMQAFLTAKAAFSGEDDEEYFLPLPAPLNTVDDEYRGIESGEIRVTSDDLKDMFEPSVKKTCELIAGQMEQVRRAGSRVKHVFLVGGFGKSPYLFDRIRHFAEKRSVATVQPTKPWSAVVRGAVASALQSHSSDTVHLRRCRRHYGTAFSEHFSASRHCEEDAYVDAYDGLKYAKGQMTWLIKKGEELWSSEPCHAEIELYRTFEPTESRVFKVKLFACDSDVAPTRSADEAAYHVTTVAADLSSVPENLFQLASPIGRAHFIANFKINISLESNLRFWLTFNGQEYGSVTAIYD